MAAPYDEMLRQMAELARDGSLGEQVRSDTVDYDGLSAPLDPSIKYLTDYYSSTQDADVPEVQFIRDYFVQLVLAAYRDIRLSDPELADGFLNAFIRDFPGTHGTALAPRWAAFAQSMHALRQAALQRDRLVLWQHASRSMLNLNEFLNALLGPLILAVQSADGLKPDFKYLNKSYRAKLDEFSRLTGGDDGDYCMVFRIARPQLRNALAHGTAWIDQTMPVVRYVVSGSNGGERVMELAEFMLLVKLGGDIGQAYLAAMAAIVILESGEAVAIERAAPHLLEIWTHAPRA